MMRCIDDMNRALDYIEETLHEKTDYEKIAQSACCSSYHFQRMFTFMTGLTLSEYIRRRKMSLAAYDLSYGNMKIIDIALNYGYESAEAFTRAFKSLHQITPSQARQQGAVLKTFPMITFQITVKGVQSMDYQIIDKEAFQIYGKELIVDSANGKDLSDIPGFWLDSLENGTCEALSKSAGYPTTVNAACSYRNLSGTLYPYMLCVIKTPLSDTTGYTVVDVPKATWVIFKTELHSMADTSKALHELNKRIYTEWLPNTQYQLAEGCNFEMYYSDHQGNFYEEHWIQLKPIKA